MKKLTKAQLEVLRAYRDNTKHNRKSSVTASLVRLGYLVSYFNPDKRWNELRISDAGIKAVNTKDRSIEHAEPGYVTER